MKRTLFLSTLLLVAGCADNRASIEITGRAAPSDTSSCKFAPGGQNIMGPGLLDVASSSQPSYSLVVYITNNLANPAVALPAVIGQVPTVIATSKAWSASAARVRVNPSGYTSAFGPNPAPLAYQGENVVPLDGQAIQPGGGASTQFVEAVTGPLGAQIAGLVPANQTYRVVLGITLQGQTGDGEYLDTGEWYFPLDVCNGCLVSQVPASCPTGEVLTRSNCFAAAPSYDSQDSPPTCATAP